MAIKLSRKKLTVVFCVLIFVSVLYILFGFGHVKVQNQQNDSVIFIDKTLMSDSTTAKLRPGTYTVTVSSPEHETTKTIKVWPLFTSTINAVENKRDFIKTVIIADSLSFNADNVDIDGGQIIDNVWYAGILCTPDANDYLAMKFTNGVWNVVYDGDGQDSGFTSLLPQSVAQYLLQVGYNSVYSNGN